jgi:WD40 repeat protein
VKIWDVKTGKDIRTLAGHTGPVLTLAFSPDGRWLATGGEDKTIVLWEVSSGKRAATLRESAAEVSAVAWSPDSRTLASGGLDRTIRLWDPLTGRASKFLFQGESVVTSLCFAPQGRRLATTSNDQLRIFDLETGRILMRLRGHTASSMAAAFSPDGRVLASAASDGTVKIWDTQEDHEVLSCQWPSNALQACGIDPESGQVITLSQDASVNVRDLRTGQEVSHRQGHLSADRPIALSLDCRYFAVGESGHTIVLYRTADGAKLAICRGNSAPVRSLALNKDGTLLVSGTRDGCIKLWNAPTGQEIASLPRQSSPIELLALSPDGNYLASLQKGSVYLWQVKPLRACGCISFAPGNKASALAYSPDGQRIAVGTNDDVQVFDSDGGTRILQIVQKNELSSRRLAFSPDGERIALANCGRVMMWDSHTGQQLLSLRCPDGCASMLAFDLSGRTLVGCEAYGKLHVWDGADTDDEILAHREALSEVNWLYSQGLDQSAVHDSIRRDPLIRDKVRHDAMALAEERGHRLVREQSSRLVYSLFSKPLFRDEVLKALQEDTQLSAAIRADAMALAQDYPEQSTKLWDHSLDTSLSAGATKEAYLRALAEAERACQLDPDNWSVWTALGIAQYRLGSYDRAIDALKRALEAYAGDDDAIPIAFLAMAQHGKGDVAQARLTFEHLRTIVDDPRSQPSHKSLMAKVEQVLAERPSAARR